MSIKQWLLVALLVGLAAVLVAGVETSAHHAPLACRSNETPLQVSPGVWVCNENDPVPPPPPAKLQPDCRYNAPTRTTVCGVPPMTADGEIPA